jgi:hypothetical protein
MSACDIQQGVDVKPRHRRFVLTSLVGVAMGIAAPASSTLGQDASVMPSAAPPLAVFMATLTGTQTEHLGEALNVTIDPPSKDPACAGGEESNSTDQTLTLTSDPVEVDLVEFAAPQDGWDDQLSFLVAHGRTIDDIANLGPPAIAGPTLLFSMPTTVGVSQTHSVPGSGELPPPADFTISCASSGSAEGTPRPTPDCTHLEFRTDTWVTVPAPGTMTVIGGGVPTDSQASFDDCSGSVDMEAGMFTNGDLGDTFSVTGGDFPTAELLDATVGQVKVPGHAEARFVQPGQLTSYDLTWALTLCRVVSGAAAC